MKKKCDHCGHTYEYKRSTSRFCSSSCRAKNAGKPPSLSVYRQQKRQERRDRHVRTYDPAKTRAKKCTLTCIVCGGPRWNVQGVLPEGQGRCQSCRKAARRELNDRLAAARVKTCVICEKVFEGKRATVLYCSNECRIVGNRKRGRYGKPKGYRPGYGGEHRKTRQQKLDELIPGTLCGLCLEPMFAEQELDLDHSDPRSLQRGEPGDRLTHSVCNRREGARHGHGRWGCDCEVCTGEYAVFAGQRCRRLSPLPPQRSAPTCRQCGKSFRATGTSAFCSNDCRIENTSPVPIYIRDCVICGRPFTGRRSGKNHCAQRDCVAEENARRNRDLYRARQGLPVNPAEPTSRWQVRDRAKRLQHI